MSEVWADIIAIAIIVVGCGVFFFVGDYVYNRIADWWDRRG